MLPGLIPGSRRLPLAVLAAAALMFTLVVPVAAAPTGTGGSRAGLASHVSDCNVTFDAGGNLVLDGSALTVAEAALLDALLLGDASLAATLDLAAAADADACVNLAIDVGAASVLINADIEVCGDIVVTATTVMVGGVEISLDLLDTELVNILEAAAAADAEACVEVTVTDNEVVVVASLAICAAATLLDTGAVSVDIGGEEFIFDGTIVAGSGLLDVGVTVQVSLLIIGTLDITQETVALILAVAECAAAATPTPTPTSTGTASAAAAATAPPVASLLPNTGLTSNEPSGGPIAATILALLALTSVGVLGYRGMAARRTR